MENIKTRENEVIKVDEKSHLYLFIKRITDILMSTLALIVLSPFIILIALLIFLQDGHNPFYCQTRIGLHGREFKMFKFRSMIANADQVLKANKVLYKKYVDNGFKLPAGEDPRITKIGGDSGAPL